MVNRRNKRRNKKKELIKPEEEFSRWSELPADLLFDIFRRVDPTFLFWIISLVCRRWQLLCWEYLLWKGQDNWLFLYFLIDYIIDVDTVAAVPIGSDPLGPALMRILESLFDKNGDLFADIHRASPVKILLPAHLEDQHLIYIAERTVKQQCVCIPNMNGITGKGFSRAIRQWKKLEILDIGPPETSHICHIINEIGINCKNLKSLRILSRNDAHEYSSTVFSLDEYNSHLIAKNLRRLETVNFVCCDIYLLGLKTIMKKCKHLKELRLVTSFRAGRKFIKESTMLLGDPITLTMLKGEGSTDWVIQNASDAHDTESEINGLWSI